MVFMLPSPPHSITAEAERDGLELLRSMNREHLQGRGDDERLESRISAYELAAKMQLRAPPKCLTSAVRRKQR